jgi:Flp pilus assembly pilin Flp
LDGLGVEHRLLPRAVGFLGDEDGQDLVEYALLILFIVLGTVAIWNNIVALIGSVYRNYDTSLWDLFWTPPS